MTVLTMAGNATLFQRILTNLINNSIKYKAESMR
jgi:signal transduction histidine kinase